MTTDDVIQVAGPVLVVVPCSGAKLWHAAPAGDLYTGSFYKLARSTADSLVDRHGGQVVILSALHGLLTLDTVVQPYDQAIDQPGAVQPPQLALQLLGLMQGLRWDNGTRPQVVTLLPRAYLAALQQALLELPTLARPELVNPLAGAAGVGYQRQRLAAMRHQGLATA